MASLLTADPVTEILRLPDKANEALGKFVLTWFEELKGRRAIWERLWQEVRELVRPNAEDFTKQMPASVSRKQRMWDDYPTQALDNLAAGVQSNLTNSTTRWFGLSSGEQAMDRRPEVSKWFETASAAAYDAIYHPHAQFNPASHELYLDWAGFGTGIINFIEDTNRIHFRAIPLAECYISENHLGIVDTVFREFTLSKRAAKLQFGDNLPKDVLKGESKEDPIKFVHAVYPIESAIPWRSVYVHVITGQVVAQGMFREFPYCGVRWKKMAGDVYGRGPGTDCLQNVRVLNEYGRLFLQSGQLAAAPPVVSEDDGVLSTIVLRPWSNIRIRTGSQFPKVLEGLSGSIPITREMINDKREEIGRAFYNDLFETKDYGNRDRVTGMEVTEDTNSRLRKIAPVVGRMEIEFLGPLIERVVKFLLRNRRIPPIPLSLRGRKITIVYLSPAAQALRGQKAQNTMKFMNTLVPYLQYDPEILDSIDKDKAVSRVGLAMDIDQDCVRSDADIAAIRKQRSDQAQKQQMAEQAMNATQGVKNMADARQADPTLGGLLQQ